MRYMEDGLMRPTTARRPPRCGSERLITRERLICLRRRREEGLVVVGIAADHMGLHVSSISTSSTALTAAVSRSSKRASEATKAVPSVATLVLTRLIDLRGVRQMPTSET